MDALIFSFSYDWILIAPLKECDVFVMIEKSAILVEAASHLQRPPAATIRRE
jgi:hypothetical protein